MSILQWLLLVLVVALVAAVYAYIRRQASSDPWAGMEDPNAGSDDRRAADDDSYIVGVRTVSRETPADRKAALGQARAPMNERKRSAMRATRPAPAAPQRQAPALDVADMDAPSDPDQAPDRERNPEPEHEPQVQEPADEVRDAAPARAGATEPDTPDDASFEIPPAATERVSMVAPQPEEHSQIFVLYVAAFDDRLFHGPSIHEALNDAGLVFGLNDMFHRVTTANGETESVFCVANMLNPGTLDPVDQDHLSTPGLALFLLVPGPREGRPAMRDMMETANELAGALGGEVLDDNRARLKAQTAQYMLDQIAEVERRATLARRR